MPTAVHYYLTVKGAMALLRLGDDFRPRPGVCPVCGGHATVWPDRVVCMARPDGTRCLGNSIGGERRA